MGGKRGCHRKPVTVNGERFENTVLAAEYLSDITGKRIYPNCIHRYLKGKDIKALRGFDVREA